MAEGEWMITTSPPDSSILQFQLPWDAAERYSSCMCVCRECVCVGGGVHVESVCIGEGGRGGYVGLIDGFGI